MKLAALLLNGWIHWVQLYIEHVVPCMANQHLYKPRDTFSLQHLPTPPQPPTHWLPDWSSSFMHLFPEAFFVHLCIFTHSFWALFIVVLFISHYFCHCHTHIHTHPSDSFMNNYLMQANIIRWPLPKCAFISCNHPSVYCKKTWVLVPCVLFPLSLLLRPQKQKQKQNKQKHNHS